jgi:hypothetical protein
MKTDKEQFDEVLRRMLEKQPQKTSEIRGKKRALQKPSLRSEFLEAQRLHPAEPLHCVYKDVGILALIETIFRVG